MKLLCSVNKCCGSGCCLWIVDVPVETVVAVVCIFQS